LTSRNSPPRSDSSLSFIRLFGSYGAPTLAGKIVLAWLSFAAYALIASDTLGEHLWQRIPGVWPGWFAGAAFAALVIGPYLARLKLPSLRIAAACIAGALIYRLAIEFAADGPLGLGTPASFAFAGSGAAALTALVTGLLAPSRFRWHVLPLALASGALGGLAFHLLAFTEQAYEGHLAWQLLVCLALHFGLRKIM
jgi:hypothetical protein